MTGIDRIHRIRHEVGQHVLPWDHQAGIHPLLARLYAARGVTGTEELDDALAKLLPPSTMLGLPEAASLLADAIAQNKRLCIVADYDCDGATACAVALRGLKLLGAKQVTEPPLDPPGVFSKFHGFLQVP